MAVQVKVGIQQSIAGDMPPEPKNGQQAIYSPDRLGRVAESKSNGNARYG